jgi:hypothetical protein
VAAQVAAALDDGQSVQAPQLRHERKHGGRNVLVGGADHYRVELTRPHEIVQRAGILVGEDEVLQANAGRVQKPRGLAQQARPHQAAAGARLRLGRERDQQRHADELAIQPLATQRDKAMRIDPGIRGDKESHSGGLGVVSLMIHCASLIARRAAWTGPAYGFLA